MINVKLKKESGIEKVKYLQPVGESNPCFQDENLAS